MFVIYFIACCFYFGALFTAQFVSGDVCPKGPFVCPETSTCCPMGKGDYGCCLLPDAVCCDDFSHCCPSGTVCDIRAMTCRKDDGTSIRMTPKKSLFGKGIVCPDKHSKCPDGSTCCGLKDGLFGCCPLPNAVCCSDHLHCCPSGTRCEVTEGRCIRSQDGKAVPWHLKYAATKVKTKPAIKTKPSWIQCSDGKQCLGLAKCCNDREGNSYCCPLKNGICCQDGRHCCPKGFRCDMEEGRCTKDNAFTFIALLWSDNSESALKDLEDTITCDDGSKCPDTSKCCPLSDDLSERTAYGCCPLQEGVCCGLTCCPKGYRCVAGVRCERNYKNYFRSLL